MEYKTFKIDIIAPYLGRLSVKELEEIINVGSDNLNWGRLKLDIIEVKEE